MAWVRERGREGEGEWGEKVPLTARKSPSPVQNGLCERERESGRGKGREKCHWLSRKRASADKNGLWGREGEQEREGEGQIKPRPVQNGLCERERGRVGEGRGGKSAIGCPEKGLALIKMSCVRERGSGRGKGRERKVLALFKRALGGGMGGGGGVG